MVKSRKWHEIIIGIKFNIKDTFNIYIHFYTFFGNTWTLKIMILDTYIPYASTKYRQNLVKIGTSIMPAANIAATWLLANSWSFELGLSLVDQKVKKGLELFSNLFQPFSLTLNRLWIMLSITLFKHREKGLKM